MKTIQSLGWFFPDSTGGSEVYVAGLVEALRTLGVDSCIAAPRDGSLASTETVGTHTVFRYPVPAGRTAAQQAGLVPHDAFDEFRYWLQQQNADVYHQHSLTFGCSVHHLQAARDAGMKTVLTIHTPEPICLRGTLLYQGSEVCDGRIDSRRCADCWLQWRGMPALAASVLAAMPVSLGRQLRPFGRAGSALAATAIAADQLATLHTACRLADRVVVVCQWLLDALLRNGIDGSRMVLSRQGITAAHAKRERVARAANAPLKIGFLGRGDPVKGVAVLVDAVRSLPKEIPLQLQLHVVESNEVHARDYMHAVRQLAAQDARIAVLPPLLPANVPDFMSGLDLLAVPSQVMETGPLVVLEAFAAGVPVIGADLGGISELVRHDINGMLLRHDDVAGWAQAIGELAGDEARLQRWRRSIGEVRTMADAAQDMKHLYATLAD